MTTMAETTTPTRDIVPPAQLGAWVAFLEAHARVFELLERELRDEEELHLTWYDVMVHLSAAPDRRLRMQELADAILLSKSGLTRLVDRMDPVLDLVLAREPGVATTEGEAVRDFLGGSH
jgi:hypothetical protein